MDRLTEEERDTGISDLDRTVPREHAKPKGLQRYRGHGDSYEPIIVENCKRGEKIAIQGTSLILEITSRVHSRIDYRSGSASASDKVKIRRLVSRLDVERSIKQTHQG